MARLTPHPEKHATRTIPIVGMDCGSCAESIAVALRREPGVRQVSVSFGSGNARIAWNPTRTDLSTLENRIRELGYDVPDATSATLRFTIAGMDCGSCAASVERAVAHLPGVTDAVVNFPTATLSVKLQPGQATTASVEAAVDRAGFVATPRETTAVPPRAMGKIWGDRRLRPALIGAALWILGLALQIGGVASLFPTVAFAAGIATAGRGPARAAWQALRVRHLDMNVLMISATLGAALLGEWSEGALVVVLFTFGSSLQALTIDRTRSAIQGLMSLTPDQATRLENNREVVVPVAMLEPGDLMRIKPGERVATDGEIVSGHSSLDQRAITGESIPVDAEPGDNVFAGSINGGGSLVVRVTAPASTSTLARIIHLVEEAQASRAPSQEMIDRFAAIYTPVVLTGAIVVAMGGMLITGDVATWFYRALVLLVIACPCALVISTPVTIVSALGAATRQGVLIKGGAALEMAGKVRAVAFDKTGTLTTGRPVVREIVPVAPSTRDDLLALAASVEAHSEHPLARAIIALAMHDMVGPPTATGFRALPGRGATARVHDQWVTIGSARLAGEMGALQPGDHLTSHIDRLAADGVTTLVVMTSTTGASKDASVAGLIGLADTPRVGAEDSVRRLRSVGIDHVSMLTGDSAAVAAAIGRSVGISDIDAGLLPEDKATVVKRLRQRHGTVAMIGDGINDAPALATADVGIAMATAGTGAALEAADIALMGDDLKGIANALVLSHRAARIIRQNIGVSLVVKALALALGIAGYVDLWIAVVADMGTSLAVTANALRLPWLSNRE